MFLYMWMVIQTLTECLPISSSGHIFLWQKMIELLTGSLVVYDQIHYFDYIVQGMNGLLFFLFFFRSWWKLVIDRDISLQVFYELAIWKQLLPVFLFGVIVDSITCLFWLCDVAQYIIIIPLSCGFLITAISLWSLQKTVPNRDKSLWNVVDAVGLGVTQGLSLLPGISRFGLTITYLQWRGYNPLDAWNISFLVQLPLLCAASVLGFFQLSDPSILEIIGSLPFLVSMIGVAIIAWTVLQYLKKIIATNQLWKFSYYMVIPILGALYF